MKYSIKELSQYAIVILNLLKTLFRYLNKSVKFSDFLIWGDMDKSLAETKLEAFQEIGIKIKLSIKLLRTLKSIKNTRSK
jgi:hypothetical protein